MRIRKRKVPLPLSLLSPVPLSDPHLFSRSPVTVVQGSSSNGATSTTTHNTTSLNITHHDHHYSQPSDHLTLTCSDTSPSDLRCLIVDNSSAAHVLKFEGVKGVRTSNDDASNTNLSTAKGGAVAPAEDDVDDIKNINNNIALLPPQSLSNNQGRWCTDDKAIPLKKRRGMSFNNTPNSASAVVDTMISMKYDSKNNEQQAATQNSNKNALTSGKKGSTKRGNTIMEGSRCSRVNGRGWRCCQPTLVGYSLCEHHLGKGRLRSMTTTTTTRPRAAKKKSSNNNFSRETHEEKKHDDDDDDETLVNKKVKLGVVKARSLSSLLGQTNSMNHIAEDHASLQHQHQDISNFHL